MRVPRPVLFIALAALGFGGLSLSRTTVLAEGQREVLAWAPMPTEPSKWIAPNRPHWKVSEIVAKHKGEQNWSETVVSDTTLRAEYISMAPGAKAPRQFHPDTRAWWIVQDGQIRFTIDGQEPFVAKKGFLVQVPYRNVYSMETVGDAPSLRLEVNIGGATTMYPIDEKPPSLPGFDFVKVRIGGKGAYDARNKPYVDFNAVVAGTEPTRRFIADDRAVANIIRGKPQNWPRPTRGTSTSSRRSSGSFSRGRFVTALVRCRSSSPIKATSSTSRNRRGISPRTGRHRCRRGWQ